MISREFTISSVAPIFRPFFLFACYLIRDERHPRPGSKRPHDEDKEEDEDLNDSNYDEVSASCHFTTYPKGADKKSHFCIFYTRDPHKKWGLDY